MTWKLILQCSRSIVKGQMQLHIFCITVHSVKLMPAEIHTISTGHTQIFAWGSLNDQSAEMGLPILPVCWLREEVAKGLRQEQKDERRKQKEVVERISVAVETGSSQKTQTLISTRAGRLPLMFVMFGLQPNSTSSASERGVYTQIWVRWFRETAYRTHWQVVWDGQELCLTSWRTERILTHTFQNHIL